VRPGPGSPLPSGSGLSRRRTRLAILSRLHRKAPAAPAPRARPSYGRTQSPETPCSNREADQPRWRTGSAITTRIGCFTGPRPRSTTVHAPGGPRTITTPRRLRVQCRRGQSAGRREDRWPPRGRWSRHHRAVCLRLRVAIRHLGRQPHLSGGARSEVLLRRAESSPACRFCVQLGTDICGHGLSDQSPSGSSRIRQGQGRPVLQDSAGVTAITGAFVSRTAGRPRHYRTGDCSLRPFLTPRPDRARKRPWGVRETAATRERPCRSRHPGKASEPRKLP
jgi:hypothetical protein